MMSDERRKRERVLLLPSMLLLVAYGADRRNSSQTAYHA